MTNLGQSSSAFRFLLGSVLLCTALLVTPIWSFAQQETAQISGKVTDPNGALVPNATIVVKSVDRGNEIATQTNSEGTYVASNLQPGLYELTIKAQGFQDKTERVQATVGARLTLTTQLGVSGAEGTVVDVVAGGVAEINTTDQQVSTVVTTKQILELPTLTRNPYALISLSGNISDGDPSGSTGRGVGAAINGQRSSSTSILLDGAENVDTFIAFIGQRTPLDSVGEFRVITSNFSAEYGRASGGIVNAVTKAGTNEFHGTAYAFNRNSALASSTFENNARGNPKAQFNRNQFGYSVGGPIVKDKLFFFNSTEWTKVRSQDSLTAIVPTTEFINASNVNTRNYFNEFGALDDKTRVISAVPCSAFFPSPSAFCTTNFGAGGNSFPLFQQVSVVVPRDAGGGFPTNDYSTVTRVDYNLSSKTQIFGRYAVESLKPFEGNYDVSPYEGFTVGTTEFNQNILLSATHQFSGSLISQTKAAYSRGDEKNTVGADPSTPTLTGIFANSLSLPVFFPGFLSTAPGVGLPTSGTQHLAQVNEDLTLISGNHNMKFGGQFIYIRDNKTFPAFQNASQILGANVTAIVTNFLNGQLAQFQSAVDPQGAFPGQTITTPLTQPDFSRSNRYKEFAVYFNDSWRVIPRLTLNLGFRYEFYGPQRHSDPTVESNFFLGSGATLPERIRTGSILTTAESGALWKNDNNNFAPRVGFALDVFGDSKTSVRGGYGIAYERNFGNVTFNVIQNPPGYAVLGLVPADLGGTLPIFTNSAGPFAAPGLTRTLPRVTLRAVDPDIVNAYSHFYSLGIEREISRGTVASVTYSGSAGRKLYSVSNINRAGTGLRFLGSPATCPGLTPSNRLSCQYSNINFRSNDGFSDYDGVTFSLDSNDLFGLGLLLTNRYTYSTSKDNLSSTFSDGYHGNFALGFVDPFNPALDYGYSDFDIRHRFVSSFVWELPFAKDLKNGFLKKVLNGFQLTGQVNIQSGTPFTIYDCTTANLTTCLRFNPTAPLDFRAPANLVSTGEPNTFIYTDLRNQDATTFVDPFSGGVEAGPYPDMLPRNSFRGPGFWNVDLGLYRNIPINERVRVQLRLEAFNVFNHTNLGVNNGSLDFSGSPFVTVSKVGNRNVQLAAKVIF